MKGRKRKEESRATELRQRLVVWQQTPESMRPALRALARELNTSHTLLQHHLINLGKWQAKEDWQRAREIRDRATAEGRPLTPSEEQQSRAMIEVERATSQYGLTRIRILKYDVDEKGSTVDKSVHSSSEAKDRAVDTGEDKSVHRSVHTSASTVQNQQGLQAPKNAVETKKEQKERLDAVRRPVDTERRSATTPVLEGGGNPLPEPTPSKAKSFSPLDKREKLSARLAEQIRKNRNEYDGELDDDERAALAAIGYEPDDLSELTYGFIDAVSKVYEKHKNDGTLPGNICSKIIDFCMSRQEACKSLGADPSDYFWPPEFTDHRDGLRKLEREEEAEAKALLKEHERFYADVLQMLKEQGKSDANALESIQSATNWGVTLRADYLQACQKRISVNRAGRETLTYENALWAMHDVLEDCEHRGRPVHESLYGAYNHLAEAYNAKLKPTAGKK